MRPVPTRRYGFWAETFAVLIIWLLVAGLLLTSVAPFISRAKMNAERYYEKVMTNATIQSEVQHGFRPSFAEDGSMFLYSEPGEQIHVDR